MTFIIHSRLSMLGSFLTFPLMKLLPPIAISILTCTTPSCIIISCACANQSAIHPARHISSCVWCQSSDVTHHLHFCNRWHAFDSLYVSFPFFFIPLNYYHEQDVYIWSIITGLYCSRVHQIVAVLSWTWFVGVTTEIWTSNRII